MGVGQTDSGKWELGQVGIGASGFGQLENYRSKFFFNFFYIMYVYFNFNIYCKILPFKNLCNTEISLNQNDAQQFLQKLQLYFSKTNYFVHLKLDSAGFNWILIAGAIFFCTWLRLRMDYSRRYYIVQFGSNLFVFHYYFINASLVIYVESILCFKVDEK